MDTLSVIVRFHDLRRLFELRRCLFSLVCQTYAQLEICLVTQRFSEAETKGLPDSIGDLLALNADVRFEIFNCGDEEPRDARSALLNLGFAKSSGRYVAILDHDDTILPDAYRQLTSELARSGVAIAFGSVAYKEVDVLEDALIVNRRLEAFVGKDLMDLFDHNFCPIHSFVIDRSRMDGADLYFDTALRKHEDYEFLLRLCAKYEASFALVGTFVGDYYLKNDGSNTNTWRMGEGVEWEESTQELDARKGQIRLSDMVQSRLGMRAGTVAEALKQRVMMGKE